MISKHSLTTEQEEFLKKYKIPEELLFDAQGEGMTEELKQTMSENNKAIAYNSESCPKNADHKFKTTNGICPQCDTAKIAVALKEHKPGFVYIAGSRNGKLIKVGFTNDTKDRVKTLNVTLTMYAGFDDWEVLYEAKAIAIGRIEKLIQSKLSEYKTSYQFFKSGKLQLATELYLCSFNKAKEAITELQEEGVKFTLVNERRHLTNEYQFKNLKVKQPTTAEVED
jgi:hypothetical protein